MRTVESSQYIIITAGCYEVDFFITGQHDTVKSTLTKNFAYEYNQSLSGIGNIFNSVIGSGSPDFVSKYDSTIGAAELGLKDLIQQYKDGKI